VIGAGAGVGADAPPVAVAAADAAAGSTRSPMASPGTIHRMAVRARTSVDPASRLRGELSGSRSMRYDRDSGRFAPAERPPQWFPRPRCACAEWLGVCRREYMDARRACKALPRIADDPGFAAQGINPPRRCKRETFCPVIRTGRGGHVPDQRKDRLGGPSTLTSLS